MNIPKQNILPLRKIDWKTVSAEDSRKIFSDMKINHDVLGELKLSVKEMDKNEGLYKLLLTAKNKWEKVLGSELISINPQKQEMYGFNIAVEPEYRRKGWHLGELLRVLSVLEMAENKIEKFGICSVDSAIYFHSKYKFHPANARFKCRDKMLDTISQDGSSGFEKIKQKAQEILKKLSNPNVTAEEQRECCQSTNGVIKEYIDKAMTAAQPEKNHPLNYTLDMVMTKDTLEANKDFYNELFKKYGIDYTI